MSELTILKIPCITLEIRRENSPIQILHEYTIGENFCYGEELEKPICSYIVSKLKKGTSDNNGTVVLFKELLKDKKVHVSFLLRNKFGNNLSQSLKNLKGLAPGRLIFLYKMSEDIPKSNGLDELLEYLGAKRFQEG
jgi:hypothetical protein